MSRVTRAALGAAAAAAGLDTPAPGGVGRFRRSLALAIPTGGGWAQGASVAAGAVLGVAFAAREVDARGAGAPELASLASGGAGLVLSLPVARRLVRVRLHSVQDGDQVAAFRFDGQAVSDDPVAVGPHGVGGATLEVTDSRLVLRRRRAGSDQALGAGEVAATVLRYAPVNPRLGFSIAGDGEGETFLPPVTDAAGQPVFPPVADRGAAFAQALSDRLARRSGATAPLPDPLLLTLILEADEPCAAAIDSLDMTLVLERRGFLDGAEKRVLRFPGGRREVRRLAIPLPPAGAQVLSASLALSVAGATTGRIARAASGPAAPPATSSEGVALPPATPVAIRVVLDEAMAAMGAEAVLAAPEEDAEVAASLWDERDALPGTRLADAAPVRVVRARPVLVPFAFPQGVALPAGPAWLVLTATRGRAVLLLAAQAGEGAVAEGGPGGFHRLAAADGRAPVARLRSPAPPPGTAEEASPGFDLSLAGTPVALQAPEDGGRRLTADLAVGLASHAGGMAELEVASDARALVTVDPPVLRYVLS
jgi:hypothetical protein